MYQPGVSMKMAMAKIIVKNGEICQAASESKLNQQLNMTAVATALSRLCSLLLWLCLWLQPHLSSHGLAGGQLS